MHYMEDWHRTPSYQGIKRLGLSILGVSKTNKGQEGQKVQRATEEMVLYSGLVGNDTRFKKGITMFCQMCLEKASKELGEKDITARFKSNCPNTTVIQVYVPTNEVGKKVDFYHHLSPTFNKRKTKEISSWLSVGCNYRNRAATIETHSKGALKESGELLCDLCMKNVLSLREISSCKRNLTRACEVSINDRWRSSLQDSPVKHSADAGSSHHFLLASLRHKYRRAS